MNADAFPDVTGSTENIIFGGDKRQPEIRLRSQAKEDEATQ